MTSRDRSGLANTVPPEAVTLGARIGLTALFVWGVFRLTHGLVTVWTEILFLASVVVPIWLVVSRVVAVATVAVREGRRLVDGQ